MNVIEKFPPYRYTCKCADLVAILARQERIRVAALLPAGVHDSDQARRRRRAARVVATSLAMKGIPEQIDLSLRAEFPDHPPRTPSRRGFLSRGLSVGTPCLD